MRQKIILMNLKGFWKSKLSLYFKITGIQNTRVFKFFNDSEMKIESYEIFLDLISKKKKKNTEEFSKVFLPGLSAKCIRRAPKNENKISTQAKSYQ